MTLEFEKLTEELAAMVLNAQSRRLQHQAQIEAAWQKLKRHNRDWAFIERSLALATEQTDEKFFRAARPLHQDEPLDQGLDAPAGPDRATIVATDGSQILPDRHAPFLYYLINIGVIVYEHGAGRSPEAFTRPTLVYPREADRADGFDEEDEFVANSAVVSVRRDLAEIGVLAGTAADWRQSDRPLLAVLDQRLLYWPVGTSKATESTEALRDWQSAMGLVRDSGGWLAGYIDRPGKSSVMTLLNALDIEQPDFELACLTEYNIWQNPTDVDLFGRFLQPGQRSPVFADISEHNSGFTQVDPDYEICFFYLNAGRYAGQDMTGQIARVDLPLWVARDKAAVAAVHGLLYNQCQVAGDYPYVLMRADEMAVVGRQDQAELDHRIALRMQTAGLSAAVTAKQQSKEFARSGKTRHEM